jgi:hypothetical protein
MKKAMLLMVFTCLLIPGVRANDGVDWWGKREREKEKKREDENWLKQNLFANPFPESGKPPDTFPNPTGEQVDMVKRMGEMRREYWEAYKEGGLKFEDIKLRFSLVLLYRDSFQMLTDTNTGVPDIFRSKEDIVQWWPYELLGNLMRLSTANGEPIPKSALGYFSFWSTQFHSDLKAKSPGGIPNYPAIPGIWKAAFPRYEAYVVARDWAELCRAPFPLPIELFVFGLVQRWPMPASYEQAMKDYQTLLTTFGEERVFAAAKRVQAAMDQEGDVTNSAALGVVVDSSLVNRLGDSPYEVLWLLLTKHDPKLARLHQFFKDRQERAFFGQPFATRENDLSLSALVDEFNRTGGTTPTPAPKSTPRPTTPISTPTPRPTPDTSIYKALYPRTEQEIAKINALRHEYDDDWNTLNELDKGESEYLRNREIYLEAQAIRSTGAEEISLLQNYVDSLRGAIVRRTPGGDLYGLDPERFARRPTSTPTPTPPPLSAVGVSTLFQDYNKKWEFTYSECQLQLKIDRWAQLDRVAEYFRGIADSLVDEELAFRASLKELDQSNQLQKLIRRMKYFDSLHFQIRNEGKKLEEWEPHPPSGLDGLNLSVPSTLPSPTPIPIPTPTPTPAPAPTPYPEAADLWREREHVVKQEYDKAWTALPDATRLQLHDEEVTFRDTIKSFDPPTRMRTLKKRIEYLKSLTPRSAAVRTPPPNPTPSPRPTPTPYRKATIQEQEEESALRHEYAKVWMELPAATRRLLHEEEIKFEIKTDRSDPAVKNELIRERIEYFKNLKGHDTEEQQRQERTTPAPTPVPTPAQTNTQEQMNFLAQEYDKMWEKFFAAQPESARPKIREEEIAFRASLKGLTGNDLLQKITQRMVYFQTYTLTLPPVK